jgi:hypothetical protein
MAEVVELRALYPQNKRAISRFYLDLFTNLYLYPNYNPIGGARVLEEALNLLSSDVKAIFRIAESNIDALNTVNLGRKRPLNVGD